MQAIELSWLRWLFVALVGGLVLALVFYLGFYTAARRGTEPTEGEELEEYAAGIKVARRPIPVLLVLVFIGVGLAVIGYLIYSWQSGVSY